MDKIKDTLDTIFLLTMGSLVAIVVAILLAIFFGILVMDEKLEQLRRKIQCQLLKKKSVTE